MEAKTGHRFTVIKDVLLFVGGLSGIAYQTITGDVNYGLLAVFTAMIGVPGLMSAVSLATSIRGSGTDSPSSSSASPESPTDSRS